MPTNPTTLGQSHTTSCYPYLIKNVLQFLLSLLKTVLLAPVLVYILKLGDKMTKTIKIIISLLSLTLTLRAETFCSGRSGLYLNDIMWEYNLRSDCMNKKNNTIWDQAPGFFLIKPSKKSMEKARDRFINRAKNEGYPLLYSSVNNEDTGLFIFGDNSSDLTADYCTVATIPQYSGNINECTGSTYDCSKAVLDCSKSIKDADIAYSKGRNFEHAAIDLVLVPHLIELGFTNIGNVSPKGYFSVTIFKRTKK